MKHTTSKLVTAEHSTKESTSSKLGQWFLSLVTGNNGSTLLRERH